MKIKLKEGNIFSLPISEYYVVGLITRISSLKVPFGYFYKMKFVEPPTIENLDLLNEKDILLKCKFGIQGFKKGTWQIIGTLDAFDKKDWPLPVFYNKSLFLPGELIYLDDNLDEIKREKALENEEAYEHYPDLGLGGAKYIEFEIAKLLGLK